MSKQTHQQLLEQFMDGLTANQVTPLDALVLTTNAMSNVIRSLHPAAHRDAVAAVTAELNDQFPPPAKQDLVP